MSAQEKTDKELEEELKQKFSFKLESKLEENSGLFSFELPNYSFRVKSTPSPIDCTIEILQSPFKNDEIKHTKMQNVISRKLRNTVFSATDQRFMQHANTIIILCNNFILKQNQMELESKDTPQKKRGKKEQGRFGPFFARAIQDITPKDNSKRNPQDSKGRVKKKPSMKTAEDVIKRINWDKKLDPNCFVVGYEDRFEGIMERSFSDFNWKDDIASVGPEELSIPQHRITYFRYNQRIVWDKTKRIDDMFGSTGGEYKIMDVMEQELSNPILTDVFKTSCDNVEVSESFTILSDKEKDNKEPSDLQTGSNVTDKNKEICSENTEDGQLSESLKTLSSNRKDDKGSSDMQTDFIDTDEIDETKPKTDENQQIDERSLEDLQTFLSEKNKIETTEKQSGVKHGKKPNYFIGVKVDNEEIINNVISIQHQFLKNKLNPVEVEALRETFQPLDKLHFTLCTCYLENEDEIQLTNQIIEKVCEEFGPVNVHVSSVNHFNNFSVIYGRPDHQMLTPFHYKFLNSLKKANINVSGNFDKYQSHMTLLKLQGSNRFLTKKLKSFVKRRQKWKFGNQVISKILLCKTGTTDLSDGFYETISQYELKGVRAFKEDQKPQRNLNSEERQTSKKFDYRLGITLTSVLRHNKFGFKIDSEGYVDLDDILSHPQFHSKLRVTRDDIYRVVRENDKKRFTITVVDDREKIKANQGHSVQVENLSLVPIKDATLFSKVIHGTFTPYWNNIQKQGLHRKKRIHIHMTTSEPTDKNAAISGMRKNCNIFIYINMEKAIKDGLEFFQSENGVILSPGNEKGFILPEYFTQVIQIDHHGKRHTIFEQPVESDLTSDNDKEIESPKVASNIDGNAEAEDKNAIQEVVNMLIAETEKDTESPSKL